MDLDITRLFAVASALFVIVSKHPIGDDDIAERDLPPVSSTDATHRQGRRIELIDELVRANNGVAFSRSARPRRSDEEALPAVVAELA